MYGKKFLFFASFCFLIIAASGCTIGESPAEKMYEHLEQTVSLESGFAEVQEPLIEAEQKEQKLFNEMLGMSMKEIDQIKKLADEAIRIADSREVLIKKEEESIDSAYEEFKSVNRLVNEIDEKALKTKADELVKTMEKRHESYGELHEVYMEALNMDRELYKMMKKEDLAIEDLKSHTEDLNKKYDEVLKSQDTFNHLTDQYNEKKKAFYKEAGFSTTDKKKAS
ncbi:YkyA family protein [Pseudalkalibacillus salsuginis]|uniref:YkyA family protein n=1 Tax=Pseudalkalibacillus salsuginis TaxID=2910972 RepID=UPI001F2060E0|nr:YkyA family protein [Pseudalkalibacillus salsuginis]MCF6412057.1 YkyA family protein [Pseudalkalibacillus salsuginis]